MIVAPNAAARRGLMETVGGLATARLAACVATGACSRRSAIET
jgi:hypothetical protein